jgi:hypothetical protein
MAYDKAQLRLMVLLGAGAHSLPTGTVNSASR